MLSYLFKPRNYIIQLAFLCIASCDVGSFEMTLIGLLSAIRFFCWEFVSTRSLWKCTKTVESDLVASKSDFTSIATMFLCWEFLTKCLTNQNFPDKMAPWCILTYFQNGPSMNSNTIPKWPSVITSWYGHFG